MNLENWFLFYFSIFFSDIVENVQEKHFPPSPDSSIEIFCIFSLFFVQQMFSAMFQCQCFVTAQLTGMCWCWINVATYIHCSTRTNTTTRLQQCSSANWELRLLSQRSPVSVALVPFLYSRFQTKFSKRIPPTTARESQTHKSWNVNCSPRFQRKRSCVSVRLDGSSESISDYSRRFGRMAAAKWRLRQTPTAFARQKTTRSSRFCRGDM